jgi:two-component system response regulator FixJ
MLSRSTLLLGACMTNLYVIEDDDVFRMWFVAMLETLPGLAIRAFSSGAEFVQAMDMLEPGVVIMDLRMPDLSGLETFSLYRDRRTQFPTILVSGGGDIPTAVEAMRLGVSDFLVKPFEPTDLFAAVDQCIRKLDVAIAHKDTSSRFANLSEREAAIFRLLVQGLANRHIAERLALSVRTVETYRAKLMAKLGVFSLPQAINLACNAGFIEFDEVGAAGSKA